MPSNLNLLGQMGAIGEKMEDFARHARDQMLSAKKKVDARQEDMMLNLAYFCDKQWVQWDRLRSRIMPLPITEDEAITMPKRETNNILRRQLTDAVGQIVGVPPRMEAIAASSQDAYIIKAKNNARRKRRQSR